MLRNLSCFLPLLALACSAPDTTTSRQDASTTTITILAMNDFHGGLYEEPLRGDPSLAIGGLPWLVGAVEAIRRESPEVVLLDAGDLFQGSWPVNATHGLGAVEAANLLGTEAVAIGNHEFDYGAGADGSHPRRGALMEAVQRSDFVWLSANIYEPVEGQMQRLAIDGVQPWVLIERRGVRLGVIGLTTTETPQTTLTAHVSDLTFGDPVEAIRAVLPELEAAQVDVVIVLAHLTGQCPAASFTEIAEECRIDGELGHLLDELPPGTIDLVVGGHAHALMAHRLGETIVLENRDKGQFLGRVDLVVGPDGVDLDASTLYPPWPLIHQRVDPGCEGGTYPLDPLPVSGRLVQPSGEALELVERLEAEVGGLCGVVGCTEVPLHRNSEGECALGNLVADAVRLAFPEVDVGVQNSGGMRADIPAGPIRRAQVHELMPFDNTVTLLEMSGEQLQLMFRIGTSGAHGVLQVSGASYRFEPGCQEGSDLDLDGQVEEWEHDCLRELLVAGQPVDPQRLYRVAVNNFMYGGGDHLGYVMEQVTHLGEGELVRDAITTHLLSFDECVGEFPPIFDPSAPRIEAVDQQCSPVSGTACVGGPSGRKPWTEREH